MKPNQKKILLLGGSYAQIPAIKAAKDRGLYTILCDYLPDNPGQKYADIYINASTTDKALILEIAKDYEVDYVFAYASDPAAPVAAYVSEKLGLPGNSYESVKILSEKHLFRQLLRDCGLNCPNTITFTEQEAKNVKSLELNYPLIVKPVDSSGSKGVGLIHNFSEFYEAAGYALNFSRSKRIIIEEYINADFGDLHGDGFVVDGKLDFFFIGDHIYDSTVNPFNPSGTTWPTKHNVQVLKEQVQKVLKKVGFKSGGINIEARRNSERELYIMEIGPRNGGHFVPQAIYYLSGINMVELGMDLILGRTPIIKSSYDGKAVAYYAVHSDKSGILKQVFISNELSIYIAENHFYKQTGDNISSFQGSSAAIGILLLTFPTYDEMHKIMANMNQYVRVEVE